MNIINIGSRIVNNYIYETENGCVMIDTGYENGFRGCMRRLEKRRISPQRISYLFLTHAHDDHAGFLNDLLDAIPNMRVILNEKGLDTLYRGQNSFEGGCTTGQATAFCKFMGLLGKGEHRFLPLDRRFSDRLLVLSDENRAEIETALGGRIIETPGHTCDSMSLLISDGSLFCGDAVMNGFPSRHNITIWAQDKAAFIASWEEIIACKPSIIYPGHGRSFGYAQLERNMRYAEQMTLRPLVRPGVRK